MLESPANLYHGAIVTPYAGNLPRKFNRSNTRSIRNGMRSVIQRFQSPRGLVKVEHEFEDWEWTLSLLDWHICHTLPGKHGEFRLIELLKESGRWLSLAGGRWEARPGSVADWDRRFLLGTPNPLQLCSLLFPREPQLDFSLQFASILFSFLGLSISRTKSFPGLSTSNDIHLSHLGWNKVSRIVQDVSFGLEKSCKTFVGLAGQYSWWWKNNLASFLVQVQVYSLILVRKEWRKGIENLKGETAHTSIQAGRSFVISWFDFHKDGNDQKGKDSRPVADSLECETSYSGNVDGNSNVSLLTGIKVNENWK